MSFVVRQRLREAQERQEAERERLSQQASVQAQQEQAQQSTLSVVATQDIKPSQNVATFARETGLPVSVVSKRADLLDQEQRRTQVFETLRRAPILSKVVANPNMAATLQESLDQLAEFEEKNSVRLSVRQAGNFFHDQAKAQMARMSVGSDPIRRARDEDRGLIERLEYEAVRLLIGEGAPRVLGAGQKAAAAASGLVQVGEITMAGLGGLERGMRRPVGRALEETGIPGLQQVGQLIVSTTELQAPILDALSEELTALRETLQPEEMDYLDKVAQGVGQFAGQFAVFIATGGLPAFAAAFAMGAGQQELRMREQGIDSSKHGLALLGGGAATAWTEITRFNRFMKILPPSARQRVSSAFAGSIGKAAQRNVTRIAGTVAREAAEEATQEAIENTLQNAVAKFTYEPDAEIFEGFVESLTVGGGVGAVVAAMLEVVLPGRLRDVETDTTKKGIEEMRDVVQAAVATTKHKQDVEEYINTATANETVGLDADGVNELFQDDPEGTRAMLEALGVSEAQIQRALEGDDILVAVSKLATMEDQGQFDQLVDIARTRPEAKTPREARRDAEEGLGPELTEQLNQILDDNVALETDERIEQNVRDQLLRAGESRDVANAGGLIWSRVFRMLEMRGVDTAALYERLGLQVVGPGLEQPEVPPDVQPEPVAPTVAPETTAKSQSLLDAFLDSATFNPLLDEAAATASPEELRIIHRQLFGREARGETAQEIADEISRRRIREVDVLDRDDEGRAELAARTLFTDVEGTELEQAKRVGYEGQDTGEAAEWIRARDKGLDMSTEARMQRAREMGFDTSIRFFHGSLAPIGQKTKEQARGMYVTESPLYAAYYAFGSLVSPLEFDVSAAVIPEFSIEDKNRMLEDLKRRAPERYKEADQRIAEITDEEKQLLSEFMFYKETRESLKAVIDGNYDVLDAGFFVSIYSGKSPEELTELAVSDPTEHKKIVRDVRKRAKERLTKLDQRMHNVRPVVNRLNEIMMAPQNLQDEWISASNMIAGAPNISPLYLRLNKAKGKAIYNEIEIMNLGYDENAMASLREEGYDYAFWSPGGPDEFGQYADSAYGSEVVILNPTIVRSVNAAFDPDYADEPTLLAQAKRVGYEGEDTGEAAEWVRARDKGLDMSDEARMQRAEDIGFDTSKVLYHGTDATFDAFQRSERGKLGAGVYLSPKTTKARQFGDIIVKTYVRGNFAPQSLRNEYADRILASIPMEERKAVPPKEFYDRLKDQTNEALAADGYDGIDAGDELLVFNPANIRSVRAAFDPDYVDDPTLLAQDQELEAPGERGPRGLTRVPGPLGTGTVLGSVPTLVKLTEAKDKTTFLHESAHVFLEVFAALEDTNPEIAAEMAPVREWLGWEKGKPLTVEMHEKFAGLDGFEGYLSTGKAPAPELRSVFEQFRNWFVKVYEKLRRRELNIDQRARDFFDRMLATEQEISNAERSYHDVLTDTMRGLMTPEQVEKHSKLAERAGRVARDRIFKKHLEQIMRRDRKTYKEAKRRIEEDVRAKLEDLPIFRALAELADEKSPVVLNRAVTEEIVGPDNMAPLEPYVSEEGVDPEGFALSMGFASADEMFQEIASNPDFDIAVEYETRRRLDDLEDDLLVNPDRAEQEAIEATFNDAQVRKLEVERDALAQRALQETIPLPVIRRRARDVIDNTPIDEVIKPGRYAMQAQSLHKKAVKAAAKGQFDVALRLTHQAMMQHELARYAYKARSEIEKINRFLARFGRTRKLDPKRIAPEFIDPIRTLMAMPGAVDQTAARSVLVQFEALKAQDNIMLELPVEIFTQENLPDRRKMTLQQFRSFRDGVKSLHKNGREQSDVEKAKRAARNQAMADVVIAAWGKRKLKERTRAPKLLERLMSGLAYFDSLLIRLPFLAEILQNGRDGPLYDILWRDIAVAYNRTESRHFRQIDQLTEILNKYNITARELNRLINEPLLDRNPIHKEKLFVILLNMGNAGNIQRISDDPSLPDDLRGNPQAILQLLERRLEKRHFDAAQEIWDLLEQDRDDLGVVHQRRTGVIPTWVEPQELVTKYGTYKGGYYPIKYRPGVVSNSDIKEREVENLFAEFSGGGVSKAQTRNGMVQTRVESQQREMSWDFNNIISHMRDTAVMIEMSEAIDNAWGVISSSAFKRALEQTWGIQYLKPLENIIKRTAADATIYETEDSQPYNKIMRIARINASIAILGLRIPTALLAPVSYFQTVFPRYGFKVVARGLIEWFGRYNARFVKSKKTMEELSPFMAERARLINREATDIAKRQVFSGKWSAVQGSGYVPMAVAEKHTVGGPLWWGVYRTAKLKGLSDPQAIADADTAIATTQGGGRIMDQSIIQGASSEFHRALTFMWGFVSGYYGVVRTDLAGAETGLRKTAQLVKHFVVLNTFASILENLIRDPTALFDEDDEEATFLFNVLKTMGRNMLIVPGASAVFSRYYNAPQLEQLSKDTQQTFNYGAKTLEDYFENGEVDGEMAWKTARRALETAGFALGVPGTLQAGQVIDVLEQLEEEDEDPSFETFYRALVAGPKDDS